MSGNKHENYEVLNLMGYGLAKFGLGFIKEFGFKTKTAFYEHVVELRIADTTGTVKNRQDLFDPFFNNGRMGWWQKGNTYLHRKILIDSLFGELAVAQFAEIVKAHMGGKTVSLEKTKGLSPIARSKFKQLQATGQEAEIYFMSNYQSVEAFANGIIDDARLYGDGYDFQIKVSEKYFLAEIKGVRAANGSVRLTENEFIKAREYKNDYGLIIISNLAESPKITTIFNPVANLLLIKKTISQNQTTYHSNNMFW